MMWEGGLRAERVAEVIAERPDGMKYRGSGYLVTPKHILTAAHVVAGAVRVRVRFEADQPAEWECAVKIDFADSRIDAAVLTIPGSGRSAKPVGFGRIGSRDAVLRCSAMGFPRFKLRTSADGSRFRDCEHVQAVCPVFSNRREGTLDLSVTPPADADDGKSPWEGMSGAAVFSGGRIVGLVAKHHQTDGVGRLAASRVDRWPEHLSRARREALERLLDVSLDARGLPDVALPAGLRLMEAGYEALLRDIAPVLLEDRDPELRDLVAFCGGGEAYRWIQGPPWAGKTALASWFALHPPRGVVPVSFFVTARFAGQADSTDFTDALIGQLARIAGREPVAHGSAVAREAERRLLLTQAAERVADDGGVLLLIVDGLDEDQSAGIPSIASLLPQRPPQNVRVLITSRPSPGVPADVTGSHPLRGCAPVILRTVPAARHTQDDAWYELSAALNGDELGRDLIGLLTAARGSLTLDDLRELTHNPPFRLINRLGSVFGRILRTRSSPVDRSTRGYVLAHETLRAAAVDAFGPELGSYRNQLNDWADAYRTRGWPEDTPRYLLGPYVRTLAAHGNAARAVAFATDLRRHNRMRAVTGTDGPALGELDAMAGLADSLAERTAVAASREMVRGRNAGLHPRHAITLARLGQPRRAEGLARTLKVPYEQAAALAGVARVMMENGDSRAAGLVVEAVALLRHGRRHGSILGMRFPEAVAEVTCALTESGAPERALALVAELGKDHGVFEKDKATALAAVAAPLSRCDRAWATDVLKAAERAASATRRTGDGRAWVEALTALARAAVVVAPERAPQLISDITTSGRWPVGALRRAAEGLYANAPDAAMGIARVAARRVRATAEANPNWSHAGDEYDAVAALAATELVREAEELAEFFASRHESVHRRCFQPVAYAWAENGRLDRAMSCLRRAYSSDTDIPEACLVRVAAGIAGQGLTDEAARLVASLRGVRDVQAGLHALAERTLRHDRQRALEFFEAALEHVAEDYEDTRRRQEVLASLGVGLAMCGRFAEAEQLAATLTAHPRTRVLRELAARLAGTDKAGALRVAVEAEDTARQTPGRERHAALSEAVLALGHAGVTARARALLERIPNEERMVKSDTDSRDLDLAEVQVKAALAAAVWSHDATYAGELVEWAQQRIPTLVDASRPFGLEESPDPWGTADADSETRLLAWTSLITAVGGLDQGYGTEILEAVAGESCRWAEGVATQKALLSLILDETGDSELARHALGDATSFDRITAAFVGAAYGEYQVVDACLSAIGPETPGYQAERMAALAAALVRVPVGPVANALMESRWLWSRPELALQARAAQLAPRTGEGETLARRILRDVLSTNDWGHALPVLAVLEPEAVLRTHDVVSAHLSRRVGVA
ncbi:trypsin-like peptidase domain-containing protein [Streptomyces milbemycinicus]|uniref:Trypsin-like peptidase domain-containing protein n=1 Tax=Streptomyces milbemycinicus TaxID=476552 RepID=A0ABW8LCW7_9ACTN